MALCGAGIVVVPVRRRAPRAAFEGFLLRRQRRLLRPRTPPRGRSAPLALDR
jgi:hypothetical protein